MNTEILLDHEPVADGGYLVRALLRVSGQAPEAEDRPPLNLSVVLDRSGSMRSMGKLDRAKEAASLLVRRLGDGDVTSVVAYDDDVRTVAGRTAGAQRQELLNRIDMIQTGGMTNLSGGWLRGRELVAEALVDGGVNRVLLLTDGLANVGITEPGQLRDLIGSAAAKGVSTTTIGFGADYDEQLLRSLAQAGGGSTYYIEEPDQAPAVFEAEIEGLMALAAQNVTVTVSPSSSVEHAAVLHQYPRQQTDDGSLRLELGDLYALEPRSLLCEFLLTSDDGAAEADVATLTSEGYVLLPNGGVEKKRVKLPIRVQRSGAAVVNPEVRRELLLLEAARAREAALEDRAYGAFEDGARKLRTIAEKMAPHAASDDEVRDEVEDLRDLAEKFDEEQVSVKDAKWMYQRAYSSAQSKRAMSERLVADRAIERKKRSGGPQASDD
ncbi:MAG: vWA domain-containing protein [Jiangellaceae bacterium]